jgi:hypothetical protein
MAFLCQLPGFEQSQGKAVIFWFNFQARVYFLDKPVSLDKGNRGLKVGKGPVLDPGSFMNLAGLLKFNIFVWALGCELA